jgi:hypothetical protein
MAEHRKFEEKPKADRESFRAAPAIPEVNVLWISEFMSCDGDSVSVTGAMYQLQRRLWFLIMAFQGRFSRPLASSEY